MTDFVFLPNRKQKHWLFVTVLLTLAACAAIGMLAVYAPLTDQDMNWGLMLILIFIAGIGIYTTASIYSASRITMIFKENELQVVNAKKKPCAFWAWDEIKYCRTFCDAFGRHYVVLAKGGEIGVDETYITRNVSRVVLSDRLIAFIIQDPRDKDTVIELIGRKTAADKGGMA